MSREIHRTMNRYPERGNDRVWPRRSGRRGRHDGVDVASFRCGLERAIGIESRKCCIDSICLPEG